METVVSKNVNSVNITWVTISNRQCLRIAFTGVLTKENAIRAAAEWRHAMTRGDKKKVVIFDCTKMKDYEPLARIIWQNTIKELKPLIDCLWVVSESKLILAGASIMSIFLSIKIHATNAEEKIVLV